MNSGAFKLRVLMLVAAARSVWRLYFVQQRSETSSPLPPVSIPTAISSAHSPISPASPPPPVTSSVHASLPQLPMPAMAAFSQATAAAVFPGSPAASHLHNLPGLPLPLLPPIPAPLHSLPNTPAADTHSKAQSAPARAPATSTCSQSAPATPTLSQTPGGGPMRRRVSDKCNLPISAGKFVDRLSLDDVMLFIHI